MSPCFSLVTDLQHVLRTELGCLLLLFFESYMLMMIITSLISSDSYNKTKKNEKSKNIQKEKPSFISFLWTGNYRDSFRSLMESAIQVFKYRNSYNTMNNYYLLRTCSAPGHAKFCIDNISVNHHRDSSQCIIKEK